MVNQKVNDVNVCRLQIITNVLSEMETVIIHATTWKAPTRALVTMFTASHLIDTHATVSNELKTTTFVRIFFM